MGKKPLGNSVLNKKLQTAIRNKNQTLILQIVVSKTVEKLKNEKMAKCWKLKTQNAKNEINQETKVLIVVPYFPYGGSTY